MKYGSATMGQVEAVINRMGGFDNWLRFAGGQGKVVFEALLAFVHTITIGAQSAATTSKEYFREAGIDMRLVNHNFAEHFVGIEVPATEAVELRVSKLKEPALDNAQIIAELSGKAEISVSQFKAFLSMHRSSDENFRQESELDFLFYVSLRQDRISTYSVRASWHWNQRPEPRWPDERVKLTGNWRIDAEYVLSLRSGCRAGVQVVSRA